MLREDSGQREHSLREVFNGLRSRQDRGAVAVDAQRLAALGSDLPASAALDGGRLLRATRRRSARPAALGFWTFA